MPVIDIEVLSRPPPRLACPADRVRRDTATPSHREMTASSSSAIYTQVRPRFLSRRSPPDQDARPSLATAIARSVRARLRPSRLGLPRPRPAVDRGPRKRAAVHRVLHAGVQGPAVRVLADVLGPRVRPPEPLKANSAEQRAWIRSFDYHWIITEHPSSPDSLFLATAGSGHTFKNLPNVGSPIPPGPRPPAEPVHAGRQVRRRLPRRQIVAGTQGSLAVRRCP